jgi:putative ATPase
VILWGPPGTETTSPRRSRTPSGRKFVELSAVNAGVKDARGDGAGDVVTGSLRRLYGALFLDEIHWFSKAQQGCTAAGSREWWVILVAATQPRTPPSR